jgi:hypothetical protein
VHAMTIIIRVSGFSHESCKISELPREFVNKFQNESSKI